MAQEVKKNLARADVLIMAAAVADFRPAERSEQKIKKREVPPALKLVPTEDILGSLDRPAGRSKKVIVGFAAETGDVTANASRKLREKKLDLIVANDVSREGIGFDSDLNQVVIIDRKGAAVESTTANKREISRLIMDRIEVFLAGKK
jgi:phosphopantothenoylcysteine decarboxylase/phosphopantothenate--cysteine ligase